MKRILALVSVLFLFNACSLNDDDGIKFHYELLPIESVVIPDSFEIGETYPITIKYFRPTTCHAFDGFYYDKNLNIRTVAVRNAVVQKDNCTELTNSLIEQTLNFYVTNNGSYIFKFWQGKNDAGEDVFLEYEIPVN